jgi:hypothetical protein
VPYKLRNTIVLAVLWAVFTSAGLFWWAYLQPRQLKKISKELQEVNKKLEDLPGLTDEVQRLTSQYQDIKRRYDSRSKEIPAFDISSQTYDYMSQGIDEAGFVKFDMKFLGTNDKGAWGYNSYQLVEGDAQFQNLYRFIYFLENGRRLYKIASLRFDQRESLDPETKEVVQRVGFDMELHAYFVKDVPELSTAIAAKSSMMMPTPSDPLKPLVTQIISTDAPQGEINADNLEVKAVLPGKAFVLAGNELMVLHVGNTVWRGTVTKIDPLTSSVEFALQEGGVARKLVKRILFDQKAKTR